MRKFNHDDDSREEVDKFFNEDGENMENENEDEDEGEGYEEVSVDLFQLEMLSAKISLKLMATAEKIASNSFFWKFLSEEAKLKKIENLYKGLTNLLKE